jgi:hypothetical protein
MRCGLSMGMRAVVAVLLFATSVAATAAEPVAGNIERQGTIHELDYGTNTVVISGTRYTVAIDANVEIAGSYGAFTMLKTGMAVAFTFDRYADDARVISEIKELPPGVVPEEY